MPETYIDSAVSSNLDGAISDYSVATQHTDGPTGDKETTYINDNWTQQLAYYKMIPELRSVIDARATWTIGKGFKADEETTMLLDTIKGIGSDTFNTILENLLRTMLIGGDSYAEIIRDDEENLLNIKPLDPEVMKIVVNPKGIIIRYEQISKTEGDKSILFEPEEIFHLTRNRVADEIHGISMIDSLEWIILAKHEVQKAMKTLMQRHVKPVMIFHLDTDDTTEIAKFKATNDKAHSEGENMYIPKDVVVPEVLAVAPNATLNPLPWLDYLNKQFYQTSQTPQIIVGGSSEFTEKATSIVYLAFQQNVEEDQLYIEEQALSQINLVFDLEFPASLENELLSDNKKDGPTNIDEGNTKVGEQA